MKSQIESLTWTNENLTLKLKSSILREDDMKYEIKNLKQENKKLKQDIKYLKEEK